MARASAQLDPRPARRIVRDGQPDAGGGNPAPGASARAAAAAAVLADVDAGEQLVALTKLVRQPWAPRSADGRVKHVQFAFRARDKGLECCRISGTWYTTRAAWRRYVLRSNQSPDGVEVVAPHVEERRREQALARADLLLGIRR